MENNPTTFEAISKLVNQLKSDAIKHSNILERIRYERSEFIKQKGYAPDTMYLNSNCIQFTGLQIMGMSIKTSFVVDELTVIMCRSSDLRINH